MKKILCFLFFLTLGLVGCCHSLVGTFERQQSIEKFSHSAVMLKVTEKVKIKHKIKEVGIVASGFAIDKDHILTVAHFCIPAKKIVEKNKSSVSMIYLNMFEGLSKQDDVKILFSDPILDLCLLEKKGHGLPVSQLAEQSEILRGEKVMVVGSPDGVFPIETEGKVALIPILDRIIISAPVWHGNSGGPVFDETGRVIGVVMAMDRNYNNIGIITPSWMIELFLAEFLINGK